MGVSPAIVVRNHGTQPDTPARAATHAATQALLNCYLRETEEWSVDETTHTLRVRLSRRGGEIRVGLRYFSPTLRHQFRLPALASFGTGPELPLDLSTLASLLLDQLADGTSTSPDLAPVLSRLLDSTANVGEHLAIRTADISTLYSPKPLGFLDTEQALWLGHQTHPTPKSRGDMSPAQRRRYSPETQGRFQLRWFAVQPELVRQASAADVPAVDLARELLEPGDPVLRRLGQRVLLPAHPWEAEYMRSDSTLFDSGAIEDLGPAGAAVTPTSSVRTVYQPNWRWQLKFSLHVRITNSQRVTLPKELERAVESARLANTVIGQRTRDAAPNFALLQDPAYLTVATGDTVHNGFSVLFRENRWPAKSTVDVSALTTLCQDHPYGGLSRLGRIVSALAAREGRPVHSIGREWFSRFVDVVVVSLIRLYVDIGLCFEAHQQNTLLEMVDGWPVRGVYRDSQGYFHREAAHDDLCHIIDRLGEDTESIFPEELADERLVYYLFLNMTLGVVNALGTAGCADENVLLADLRVRLESERARRTRYPASLVDRLLDDPQWPCKANLRTRLHDMDELVGDIATQSVYVKVANPLRGVPNNLN